MTTVETTEQAPPRRRTAEELLADTGLTGWEALRALAEFCDPDLMVAAQCRRLDETGVNSALDHFLQFNHSLRREGGRTYPQYLATEDDLWALAHRSLEKYVRMDKAILFDGSKFNPSQCEALRKFRYLARMLGGTAATTIIADIDRLFLSECGDAWHVYKYVRLGFDWPTPPDLEAIERFARSIPEDQWGGDDRHGRTPDLESVLRAALEEKRTGRRPEVNWSELAWVRLPGQQPASEGAGVTSLDCRD